MRQILSASFFFFKKSDFICGIQFPASSSVLLFGSATGNSSIIVPIKLQASSSALREEFETSLQQEESKLMKPPSENKGNLLGATADIWIASTAKLSLFKSALGNLFDLLCPTYLENKMTMWKSRLICSLHRRASSSYDMTTKDRQASVLMQCSHVINVASQLLSCDYGVLRWLWYLGHLGLVEWHATQTYSDHMPFKPREVTSCCWKQECQGCAVILLIPDLQHRRQK